MTLAYTGQWGEIAAENLKETSGSGAYAEAANKAADGMAEMYLSGQLSVPTVIAEMILKAVTAQRPKTRYTVGYMARPTILLRRLLSDRTFDRVVRSMAWTVA